MFRLLLTQFVFIVLLTFATMSFGAELLKDSLLDQKELCGKYNDTNPDTDKRMGRKLEQLRIGYRADAAPFSYKDSEGKPSGFIVEICTDLAGSIVGEGRYLFIEVTSESRFIDLAEGKIDLLCDSSTLTLERSACFDHTLLTFPSGPALAYALPLRKFKEKEPPRIGILGGVSSTRQQAQKKHVVGEIKKTLGLREYRSVAMGSYDELFAALNKDLPTTEGLDFIFADREILLAKAQKGEEPPLKVLGSYLGYEPYTIYMRPDRDFRFLVDTALGQLYSSTRIHRILKENFDQISDTVGQMIILQRIPEGNIYKANSEH